MLKSRVLWMPTLLVMMSVVVTAQDQGKSAPADPVGYFFGLSFGQQLSNTGIRAADIDVPALMAGFKDGIAGKDSALSDDQLRETQTKIQALVEQRQTELRTERKAAGEKYLAENVKKDGVKAMDGGVQYKVLTAGKGESPKPTDTVKVHYTGKLISGEVFDSSVQRGEPATFRVNQVIQGWQLALQQMKVGSKWMLYIPSELAYGEAGSRGAIGPNEVLVFEVELLEIQ